MPGQVNVDPYLAELRKASDEAGFTYADYGRAHGYPIPGLVRHPEDGDGKTRRRHIYFSAGIHGDEPAGPLALLQLLRENALPQCHHYYICPLLNPGGIALGTRNNPEDIDLNRDYASFRSRETQSHRDWLLPSLNALHLSIHLHEDWEMEGFYFYELPCPVQGSRAAAIRSAAARHLPIETSSEIDGHPASDGVIAPTNTRENLEGWPEALFFRENFGGSNYTLETPSKRDLGTRVRAQAAACLAAIDDCAR